MSNYWWWLILTQVTGNPLLALVLLFAGGWALDQFTFGILPSPLRAWRRFERTGKLQRELANNPSNRRARFELADLLCDQRRFGKALEVLKPNVAAGDDDAATMYLMGVAAYGSGHPKEAETFLGEAQASDAEYRMGAIFLEQGRGRLANGDAAGARAALEELVKRRKGTVQGRVLLARACAALGEGAKASELRKQAWSEYASSPRFQQRQERWWAWRLQPWRPVLLVVAAAGLAFGMSKLSPTLSRMGGRGAMGSIGALGRARAAMPGPVMRAAGMDAAEQQRFREALATPKHPGGGPIDPKRFERLPDANLAGTSQLRGRYDPTDTDPAHAQRMIPGDMLCRIWARYGAPTKQDGLFAYMFRDTTNGVQFSAYSAGSGPAYGAALYDHGAPIPDAARAQAEASVGAFDQLLDETPPVDCEWKFEGDEGAYRSGVKNGVPFAEDL
ncbi:MAG: hypothetical protein JST54_02300 [Deltaproteobacteria bacterium]|nr:hypothetical protein [Deltaproteobacteria bacterium]